MSKQGVESHVVQNPYYGDAGDFESNSEKKSQNNVDFNDVESVTATRNVYYQL